MYKEKGDRGMKKSLKKVLCGLMAGLMVAVTVPAALPEAAYVTEVQAAARVATPKLVSAKAGIRQSFRKIQNRF